LLHSPILEEAERAKIRTQMTNLRCVLIYIISQKKIQILIPPPSISYSHKAKNKIWQTGREQKIPDGRNNLNA
jgi:hypothetical protein